MNLDELAVEAQHNPQAFGGLYDQLYSRVYNYARYRCNDSESAEDLTATIFEKLLTGLHSFTPGRGGFEPWLWAVARNTLNSSLRAAALRAALPWEWFQRQADPGPSPEETALLRESEAALLKVLPTLNARQRDLLGLKYGSGLSNGEIAGLTGLSEGNVAVTLHRAIAALKKQLLEGEELRPHSTVQKEAEHAE